MKKVCLIVTIALLFALVFTQKQIVRAQNDNAERHRNVRNPKTTVIIDYVDSFEHHKPGHDRGKPDDGEEPPPPDPDVHDPGEHFELIGGKWADSDEAGVVDPSLTFIVDLRGFPDGSKAAIQNAFGAWEAETDGDLVLPLVFEDVTVVFGDDINTYSLRNMGGGGVLAATYITWDDADDDGDINDGEEFLEMDVIHNFTVKWGTDLFTPRGKWWDVQNVAVHEVGHVFGLGHPGNGEQDKVQTMYASAPPRETSKRTLESDGDIPGINSTFLGY